MKATFTGLAGGTYPISVRNLDGTCVVTDTDVTLTNPELPTITLVTPANPSDCGVDDGSITVTATGASIEYSIDGGLTWQVSNIFNGLSSGAYYAVVRNTDGTCQVLEATNPIVLTAPNAPSVTNVSSTDPTDCAVSDGTITITATGGTAPLEYSIDGGTNWIANGGAFIGLAGGTYNTMVRNANNSCDVIGQIITIIDKVAPTISAVAYTDITDWGNTDGTITITASGTGTVEYSIDGGAMWSQSGTFTALTAGTYQIRVRNIDGTCIVSAANVIIAAPVTPIINNVAANNPTNCGTNDGSIILTATASGASRAAAHKRTKRGRDKSN
jgi:hypothetical protein